MGGVDVRVFYSGIFFGILGVDNPFLEARNKRLIISFSMGHVRGIDQTLLLQYAKFNLCC